MSPSDYDPSADDVERSHWATLRTLLQWLWPAGRFDLKARVAVALVLLAAAKVTTVYVPFLYKEIIDRLTGDSGLAIALPVGLILAYGAARVMQQGFGELRDAVFAKVGQHALRSVALATFRHLHLLSLRFHLERRTGGVSRAIERGTKAIDFLLRFSLFNVLPSLLEIGLVCGVLFYKYNAWLALVTFVAIAFYIYFTVAVTEWRTKYRREMNRQDSEANTKAIDSLLNFETVKYFGNEEHEAQRFDKALARYETAAVKSQTTLAMLNIGQGLIVAIGQGVAMAMSGYAVVQGTMTIGDFVLINTLLFQVYIPLNFLGFVYREIKQSLVDMEKMFELLRVDREVADRPDAQPLAVNGGTIEFDRVKFNYDQRRTVLDDVSFTVPAGKTVAIVGPSGAGKSTISRILFRFYDVDGGTVRIDGQDIRGVTQASLRDAIGMVPQDTVLFNDTIRYNIRYGRPDASDDEIEEAARLAHIDGFIAAQPDGYDALVGERGLKVSGGEKQRIAIARTILKRPAIMLFDEATSALDSHTERDIQASLREVSENRTTLVIAHRLSTVVDADEIIVLDQGRIVERGRHQDLLAAEGAYAAMWQRQQEAAEYRQKLAETLGEEGSAPISAGKSVGAHGTVGS